MKRGHRPPFTTAPVADSQRFSDPLLFTTSARADSQWRWPRPQRFWTRWTTRTNWFWLCLPWRSLPSCLWRGGPVFFSRPPHRGRGPPPPPPAPPPRHENHKKRGEGARPPPPP